MSVHERRRLRRWNIGIHARVKLDGAEKFSSCRIQDLSLQGMQLWLPQRLRKDTFQKMTLVLSKDCCIGVEAWQVWHKTVDKYNVYGLYFSNISAADKEKIYQFMRTHPALIGIAPVFRPCENFTKHLTKEVYNSTQATEGGGEFMEDRRVFQRFKTYFSLRYLDPSENKECEGQLCDISAKGVGFVSKDALKPRTPLEMWLHIPDRGEPLYTRGEVMWARPQGGTEYRCGVCLDRADLLGVSRVLRAV